MSPDLVYLVVGFSISVAVILPKALHNSLLSEPMVLVALGALLGALPFTDGFELLPQQQPVVLEHVAELTVLVALMGVGLALDRPLNLRSWGDWRAWSPAWRLLGIAMPLCILAMTALGWALGLAPAVALLLGAACAPTDPVLASDVQVGGPNADVPDDPDPEQHADEIDEKHEVRFALTSEAGLNDGLAFPFVYAAIFLTAAPLSEWGWSWVGWDLVGKSVLGTGVGVVAGLLFAKIAFGALLRPLRVAESGESLAALAAMAIAYGAAEVLGGYGFLSVFACAMAIRSQERRAEYHAQMHELIERLELILTLLILLGLGFSLTSGVLAAADWRSAVLVVALIFVIRPLSGEVSLVRHPWLAPRERHVIAFFGVRGIGSVYYAAYALNHGDFGVDGDWVWATVSLMIVTSVVVHGLTAARAIRWLDSANAREGRGQGAGRTPQPPQ